MCGVVIVMAARPQLRLRLRLTSFCRNNIQQQMSHQLSVVIILSVTVMTPSTLTQEPEAIGSYDPTKAVYPGNIGGGDINISDCSDSFVMFLLHSSKI